VDTSEELALLSSMLPSDESTAPSAPTVPPAQPASLEEIYRSPLEVAAKAELARAGTKGQVPASFGYKLSIGHQEIDRIVDEVESIYSSLLLTGTEWIGVEQIGNMLVQLNDWYEDYDEFEDACGGSFEEFLGTLPQFEIRRNEQDKPELKVLLPDPDAPPTLMTLRVEQSTDLWRVLFKSGAAAVRIPHLEFEIGADSKRRIDTVYNHINNAIWNLSSHMRGAQAEAGAEFTAEHIAILDTVEKLEALLDVNEPFIIVVDDPTGASRFKPDDGIEVDEM
jgi:hypothetical protein